MKKNAITGITIMAILDISSRFFIDTSITTLSHLARYYYDRVILTESNIIIKFFLISLTA